MALETVIFTIQELDSLVHEWPHELSIDAGNSLLLSAQELANDGG